MSHLNYLFAFIEGNIRNQYSFLGYTAGLTLMATTAACLVPEVSLFSKISSLSVAVPFGSLGILLLLETEFGFHTFQGYCTMLREIEEEKRISKGSDDNWEISSSMEWYLYKYNDYCSRVGYFMAAKQKSKSLERLIKSQFQNINQERYYGKIIWNGIIPSIFLEHNY
jgi:hypothetical protein